MAADLPCPVSLLASPSLALALACISVSLMPHPSDQSGTRNRNPDWTARIRSYWLVCPGILVAVREIENYGSRESHCTLHTYLREPTAVEITPALGLGSVHWTCVRGYEHPRAVDDGERGAWREGEAWGGDPGCRASDDECVAVSFIGPLES
ncbi:hypothetical protein PLEOSDRAFT_1087171 [Pleurotus ostreatus PC15]|uniref:Uncharacterized protein n=1 Tax=Pleurotus ostreatus (strain PC15) TaxID=1137138 RepID=A0A067NFM0_PLEO1|nr:hypothetical protein PLEOSDRAFT_1087171 [Pleurotus ostreatus PC15]